MVTCVLDACCVINLIHIDYEDESLCKSLEKNIDFHISHEVNNEISRNITKPLSKSELKENSIHEKLQSKQKYFKKRVYYNSNDSNKFDTIFLNEFQNITGYSKNKMNGEFCSAALAMYLSRQKNNKLFFHTDDLPASEEFNPHFKYHQIGYIEDTVDLLCLLYRLDIKMKETHLKEYLSRLSNLYGVTRKNFLNHLRTVQSKISSNKKLIRDNIYKKKLDELINSLENVNLSQANEIINWFSKKRKYLDIKKTFDENTLSITQIKEQSSNNKPHIIDRIKSVQNKILKKPIHRF